MKGLIDYREARLDDAGWWRRTRMLQGAMARDKDRDILQTIYDLYLALVANGRLTEESWKEAQDQANELKSDILDTIRPWAAKSIQDKKKKDFGDWRQRYIDNFGVDPYDPEFQEWEAQRIAELEQEDETEETEEQRVTRKLNERDDNRA